MITALLIATAGIINPMDMSGNYMYPSGVKECDKYPRFAPPASKLAKLALPHQIIANDNRVIPSGHYLVSLSVSRNEIVFFEGHTAVYTINVERIDELEKNIRISTAQYYTDSNADSTIILKQGKYKVVAKVKIYKEEN